MSRFKRGTTLRTLTVVLLLGLLTTGVVLAATGDISTVAGTGTAGFLGDGGPATNAQLFFPESTALDSSSNLFLADQRNSRIRKVDTAGNISTVAGNGTAGFAGDGGPATSAQLNGPYGMAVDSADNLFIAVAANNRIRKVDTSGTISTVAGTGVAGFSGDGGPATSAQVNSPRGVAVDSAGNLFIADKNNHRIRKVDTSGIISTVAGDGTAGFAGDGGPATSAQVNSPLRVAVDSSGNLFIGDAGNHRIRKVDTSGIISTVAGDGTAGFAGDGGPATSAQLNDPNGVALDTSGNLFIADKGNSRIRKVDTSGNISTVAGDGTFGFSGDGGAATSAQLKGPSGVTLDTSGNLFIADTLSNRIRKVDGVAAVIAADLSIAKSATPPVALAGQNMAYTVTVTNNGPGKALSLVVTDTLPGTVAFVSASAGCGESGGTVTCTAASLSNGANVAFTITVTAPSVTGSISNTASMTAATTDPTPANDSVTLVTTVAPPPALPGLSTWGLGALALGLVAAVLFMRRRSTSGASR